jgi:hypothetical protein
MQWTWYSKPVDVQRMTVSIDRSHARQLVIRAIVLWVLGRISLWVLVRMAAAMVGLAMSGGLLAWNPLSMLIIAGVVAFLSQTDARVMRESIFYANLGVPEKAPAIAGACVALIAELVLALVLH